MYLPRLFDQRDHAELLELMRAHPFATVVVTHEGELEISHVPVLILDGEPLRIQGHVARGNPLPAALSDGASPAAPLGGIRQHEQVQTGEQECGEREQRQEGHLPPSRLLPSQGDDVDDDGHREGNGQPAVGLPNPRVPVQWDLL